MSSIAAIAEAIPENKHVTISVYWPEDLVQRLDVAVAQIQQYNAKANRSTVVATMVEAQLKGIHLG